MSNRTDSNEVVLYRPGRGGVEVVEVSKETWRWSIRECTEGPERRTIRRPFAATIEKAPNLLGPVLRLASTADEVRTRARRTIPEGWRRVAGGKPRPAKRDGAPPPGSKGED